uniref:Uncharacterized protein LOC100181912 n=1 Tax=Phallusia mammillata TaxID=59560 RepID=A0A6F9DIA7_9ASCI|nr:uncharacterized protein LOC100181912 [Phallusia mammillata]
MVRTISLCALVVACSIFAVDAQVGCPNPAPIRSKRATCGNVQNPTQSECVSVSNCCWDSSATPNCYQNPNPSNIASIVASAESGLPSITKPADIEPVVAEARKLGGVVDESTANTVTGRALNYQTVALLIDFPTCPVETPVCHRTPCGVNYPDAEVNPLSCFRDPRCCFDKQLFLHKAAFGAGYLGGAPVCYYGPTSRTYVSFAYSISASSPGGWNPFFQQIVVDVFENVLDTAFNFNQTLLCRITNAFNIPLFRNPKCGWEGITKLQCSLKGCCYNSDDNECVYPRTDLPYSYNGVDLYPELNTDRIEETQCAAFNDFSFNPNIYRRLPCKCPTDSDTVSSVLLNCPSGRCCPNYLALVPQLADLSAATSGVTPTFSSLFPFLIGGGGGLSGVAYSQFYCPYLYFPIPGLTPLFSSVENCCKQHACYHKKRLIAPWGPWSRCSSVCGPGLSRRTRICNSPVGCPGATTDSRPCDSGPCAQWSQWSQFGPCSYTCGTLGVSIRTRRCSGFNCPGLGQEQRPCNRFTCASWRPWQPWSICSRPCGSLGLRSRRRFCYTTNNQQSNQCPGSSTQTDQCNRFPCGTWSGWQFTSDCTGLCGTSGTRNRERQCQRNGQAGGTGCPGSSTSTVSCQNPQCNWGAWGAWNTCSQSCTRQRSRVCLGGGQCPPPTPTQNEPCFDGGCLQDPVPDAISWGDWSGWSGCNLQCNGQRSRMRRCLYNGQTNSIVQNQACICLFGSNYLEQEQCNQGQCGATWSAYNQWSICTRSCGPGGTRSRQRTCRIGSQTVDSSSCPGSDSISESCFVKNCPVPNDQNWTQWGSWGECPKPCRSPGDRQAPQRLRVRCPGAFDANCTHDRIDIERQDCNNYPCPSG